MAATLPERRHDRPSPGPAVRLEDSLDCCNPDVREIDGPHEDGAGLERLQRAQGGAQRGDGTGLGLRVLCDPVHDPKSPAVRLLADDLRDTLRAARTKYDFGRALAAPQIGAPVRVILVQVGKFRACMVNPEITDVGSEDFLVWDDCFSFPSLLVRVNRAYRATLRYTDIKGKTVTMDLEGPMAELLQHELDHLDGILALDQPAGLHPFAYQAEWEKLHKPAERYGPPRPREV